MSDEGVRLRPPSFFGLPVEQAGIATYDYDARATIAEATVSNVKLMASPPSIALIDLWALVGRATSPKVSLNESCNRASATNLVKTCVGRPSEAGMFATFVSVLVPWISKVEPVCTGWRFFSRDSNAHTRRPD